MTDSMGREVPAAYVQPWDKARDKAATAILSDWHAERARLEFLMAKTLARLNALIATREAETGVALADRGNFAASSFDGLTKVEMKQQYRIALDDQVTTAKTLMLEYATGLIGALDSGETKDVLMQFIEQAFSASAAGSLPASKIVALKNCGSTPRMAPRDRDTRRRHHDRSRQMPHHCISPSRPPARPRNDPPRYRRLLAAGRLAISIAHHNRKKTSPIPKAESFLFSAMRIRAGKIFSNLR